MKYQEDWDGYGAAAPHLKMLHFARYFLAYLKAFYKVTSPVISLTRIGGCTFEWELADKWLEIEIDSVAGGSYVYKDRKSGANHIGKIHNSIDGNLALRLRLMFFAGDFSWSL